MGVRKREKMINEKGEIEMNKEIRKEIKREYYRAQVQAKIDFAKEHNIVLKINPVGLVACKYKNNIVGGVNGSIYEQYGKFSNFEKRFLDDLKKTRFIK